MSIFLTQTLVPVNTVWFDTFENWTVNTPKTLTKHPVVPSPEVTDHAQSHNVTLSFRGYVGTPAGVAPGVGPERMRLFLDTIGTSLVTIASPFGIFANMVIVSAPNSERTGSMVVDIQAEQIRIASIAEVPIPPRMPNPAAAAQQASTADAGAASASSTAGAGASLASQATDALSSLFGG